MLCSSEAEGQSDPFIPGSDATLILDVSAILYIYDPVIVFPMYSIQLINNQRRQTIKKKKVCVCVWGGDGQRLSWCCDVQRQQRWVTNKKKHLGFIKKFQHQAQQLEHLSTIKQSIV